MAKMSLKLVEYKGSDQEVTIPSFVDDRLVRYIANDAFANVEVERINVPRKWLYDGMPWGATTAFINYKTKKGTWENPVKVNELLKLSQSCDTQKVGNILNIN